MAYTFEELFDLAPPYDPSTHYLVATTTLTIAQEDGRCAYGSGLVHIDPNRREALIHYDAPAVDPSDAFYIFFSDRSRFGKDPDEIGLKITSGGASGECDLTIVLWRWGAARDKIHLKLPPDPAGSGKLYTGLGSTIGHGRGRGLHSLSFNHLAVYKIEIG